MTKDVIPKLTRASTLAVARAVLLRHPPSEAAALASEIAKATTKPLNGT